MTEGLPVKASNGKNRKSTSLLALTRESNNELQVCITVHLLELNGYSLLWLKASFSVTMLSRISLSRSQACFTVQTNVEYNCNNLRI